MKFLNLILVFVTVASLASCGKDDEPQAVNSKELTGVWELRLVSGGMRVYNPDDYKRGNGDIWVFTPSRYARVLKDSIHEQGTYTISRGTGIDPNSNRAIDQFLFSNLPPNNFELKNDTLAFYYGPIAADGAIISYMKISDDTTWTKGN